jgi:hypothetical protein
MLAITHPPVLPSAMLNGVGTPVAIISQLNTLPALPPVNASMAASRLTTHDSGPGWLATPFLYDSFIHNSTPVLSRRTQHPARSFYGQDRRANSQKTQRPSPASGQRLTISRLEAARAELFWANSPKAQKGCIS